MKRSDIVQFLSKVIYDCIKEKKNNIYCLVNYIQSLFYEDLTVKLR